MPKLMTTRKGESARRRGASKKLIESRFEMRFLDEIERQILSWPEVSAQPHRFGGREFQFHDAEIGHVHRAGLWTFRSHVR